MAITEKRTDKALVMKLVRDKVPYAEIAKRFGISKPRITQIKKETEAREATSHEPDYPTTLEYFEYKDHANCKDGHEIYTLPILACVGIVRKETDDTIWVQMVWSKTLDKIFTEEVIFKAAIVKRAVYRLC